MLVISVEGGYNRRANNERTLFAMANMMAAKSGDKFNATTKLLTMAGYEWQPISRGGEPVEQLEGRKLGAVQRALKARGAQITGADGLNTGMGTPKTRTRAGTSGAAGARPRTAARSTTSRAGNGKTGAGMTTMAAGMGSATPRKRGRPRRTPIS